MVRRSRKFGDGRRSRCSRKLDRVSHNTPHMPFAMKSASGRSSLFLVLVRLAGANDDDNDEQWDDGEGEEIAVVELHAQRNFFLCEECFECAKDTERDG